MRARRGGGRRKAGRRAGGRSHTERHTCEASFHVGSLVCIAHSHRRLALLIRFSTGSVDSRRRRTSSVVDSPHLCLILLICLRRCTWSRVSLRPSSIHPCGWLLDRATRRVASPRPSPRLSSLVSLSSLFACRRLSSGDRLDRGVPMRHANQSTTMHACTLYTSSTTVQCDTHSTMWACGDRTAASGVALSPPSRRLPRRQDSANEGVKQ